MSHIETAVLASKRIEAILREGFAAEGRGLHEYLGSVEHRIPSHVVKKARYIASVRNQVVHQEGVIFDLSEFNQAVEYVVLALNTQLEQERIEREHQENLKREQERIEREYQENLKREQERIKREHQERLNRDQQKNHDKQYLDGGSNEKACSECNDINLAYDYVASQNRYLLFFLLTLICTCTYLFLNLLAEKEGRKNDARNHSSRIGYLRQELDNAKSEVTKSCEVYFPVVAEDLGVDVGEASLLTIKEETTIEIVESEDDIKSIQKRLNELAFEAGQVDGLFGSATTLAIQKFQKLNGLNPTGVLLEVEL
ncbi:peptidoglycan-binding domain-containing protein, partial [Alkalimonas mucilaginosa]